MNTPCLSVIMPIYNEKKTVYSVISSVLKQPEVRELILINDGSNDGTHDELENIKTSDSRIILIHHKYNLKILKNP